MKDQKTMSLADIKAQIAELERKAEEMVKAEKDSLIEDMKEKIVDYGITADELGFGVREKAASKSKSTAQKTKAPVKYRNEDGLTWSGRQGPKPKWIKEILAVNGDIEKYRI